MPRQQRDAQWFIDVLDSLEDFVFVKGERSHIVWANRRFREFFGISEEDMDNSPQLDAEHVDAELSIAYVRDDHEVFTSGRPLKVIEPSQNVRGETQTWETVKTAVKRNGQIALTAGVSRLLDDERSNDDWASPIKKIRTLTEASRQVVSTLPFPVVICDVQQNIVASSSGFDALVKPSLKGPTYVNELLAGDSLAERVQNCIVENTSAELQNVKQPDGKIFNLFIEPWSIDDRVVGAQVSVDDITERTRLARELEEFVYVTSHDLSEPLRMVRSYLGLLEAEFGERLEGDARVYVDFAIDGAVRMQTLTGDLLNFSRLGVQALRQETVDLNAIMRSVVANVAVLLKETGGEVVFDSLPQVIADTTAVETILTNLVANGLKFHKEGVAPRVNVVATKEPHHWRISVSDEGLGIRALYHERIFKMFQRLNNTKEYSGTGIGLSSCKRCVEKLGGKIGVESEENMGATFWFTIPRGEKA